MIKPPNFFKNWKQNGFKKARQDFIYHFQMGYSAEQGLKTQIYGYIGSIVGVLIIIFMFYSKGMWFVSFAAMFSLLILWANLRMCLRQRKELKEMEKLAIEEMEQEDKATNGGIN